MSKYFVRYKVAGFGEQAAGPYSWLEASEHLDDIRGFEGVSDAYIAPATSPRPTQVPPRDSEKGER